MNSGKRILSVARRGVLVVQPICMQRGTPSGIFAVDVRDQNVGQAEPSADQVPLKLMAQPPKGPHHGRLLLPSASPHLRWGVPAPRRTTAWPQTTEHVPQARREDPDRSALRQPMPLSPSTRSVTTHSCATYLLEDTGRPACCVLTETRWQVSLRPEDDAPIRHPARNASH
ncbi:hypothetical protein C8Q77DRAFT_503616 [Trametes polyzona]|nr:hypothetical protein C8Q77DRAFT_503616 [Trametes polyzona]